MNITAANLNAIYYTFVPKFQSALLKAPTFWQEFGEEQPSVGAENRYPWIDRLPQIREWVGERVFQNLSARGYAAVNRDFEGSVEMDRNTVLDDQWNLFGSQVIPMLGMQAGQWPDALFQDAMANGHLSTKTIYQAFDGQPYFNASHPQNMDAPGGSTYSNLLSGLGAFGSNAVQQAYATMRAYKGADAQPLNIVPDTIIVPPALEIAAKQIVQATLTAPAVATGQNAAGGVQENVLKGMFKVVVFPRLAGDDTTWYLACTTMGVKPIIFQKRKAPEFVMLTQPTAEPLFRRKKFQYGVDMRGAFAYSFPFLMAKCSP